MCAMCLRHYTSTATLKVHLRKKHLETDFHGAPRLWACGMCTTPLFESSKCLLEHVVDVHSNSTTVCGVWDLSTIMRNLLGQPHLKAAYDRALSNEFIGNSEPVWDASIIGSDIMLRLRSGSFENPRAIVEMALHYAQRAAIIQTYCENVRIPIAPPTPHPGTSLTEQPWHPTPMQSYAHDFAVLPIPEDQSTSFPGRHEHPGYSQ